MNKQSKIASKLIYASAAIGMLNALLSFDVFTKQDWIAGFLSMFMIIAIGVLTAKGYSWVKYLLIVLVVVGLSEFSYVIQDLKEYPINGVLSILMAVLQVIATMTLFIKRKPSISWSWDNLFKNSKIIPLIIQTKYWIIGIVFIIFYHKFTSHCCSRHRKSAVWIKAYIDVGKTSPDST